MQNRMTYFPPLFALVPVPYEALLDAGIEIGDPLQFTVDDGSITMELIRKDDMDNICPDTSEHCPRILLDYGSECNNCPYYDNEENEVL